MRKFRLLLVMILAGPFCARSLAEDPAPTTEPGSTLARLDVNSIKDRTAALAQYQKQSDMAATIRTRGGGDASMLVTRWANEFCTVYPKIQLEIVGGGVDAGLTALLAGQSDLLPSVRVLNDGEVERFKTKFGYPPTQIVVALDAMAIYVHLNNPIAQLTREQLGAIYSRAAPSGRPLPETWGDLGVTGKLSSQSISRFSLNEAHSSYQMFRNLVLGGEDFRFDTHFERVPGGLIDSIAADEFAIGFCSVMFASEGTRFVPVVGEDGKPYLPNYENVLSGAYPFARKIVLVMNKAPGKPLPAPIVEFLRFAVSRRGQRIVGLWGSYPLTLEQQTEAIKQLAP